MAKKNKKNKVSPSYVSKLLHNIGKINLKEISESGESITTFTYGLGKNEERIEAELKHYTNQCEDYPEQESKDYNKELVDLITKHSGSNKYELEGKSIADIQSEIKEGDEDSKAEYYEDREKLDEKYAEYLDKKVEINKANNKLYNEEFLDFEPYFIEIKDIPKGVDVRGITPLIAEPSEDEQS